MSGAAFELSPSMRAAPEASGRGGAPRPRSIVLAGGGTGGHISPGLAIAERIGAADPSARVVFACSTREVDANMLREAAARFIPIRAEPLSLNPRRLLRCLLGLVRARRDADRLLRECRPDWVVSLGGYVTPPVVAAARRAGVPVLLVNLDATPGKANRLVARRATKVVSAVPVPSMPRFASAVIGMPLRRIAMAPASTELCRAELGLDLHAPVLLITGASQGAQSLNDLACELARSHSAAFADWQVLHLCGPSPAGGVTRYERAWREAGIRAAVIPFLHRMGVAWGAAELAVSRAGASSVAEAQCNQVPTIFAPYPYHKDQHQRENALPLVEAGGALVETDQIDPQQNLAGLGARILELMAAPDRRAQMRRVLAALPPPSSAEQIADFVLRGSEFRGSVPDRGNPRRAMLASWTLS
ncbi:MAG: UDP-N-acetylglucosamine--N-acetylmuramyl-(pentapeptide) pyrophosphoryl-undecaprenol N-acetylglucosamine transferase [Planctomycetes bacterium]|nr:UDP-N-acetylglucosamine--N-acetylmuramyl-(pentapeptide) pyrophosphoryl-undecaprenol N-acetylglucosamine transferase [Planctomycetota bacterium]